VEGPDLIPELHEAEGLAGLFEDIAARHWTGWTGVKSWSSLDHNLAIEATWQRTGGATLRVTLSPDLQRWKAEGTIDISDMALEGLGAQARAVLGIRPQDGQHAR
jgi:Family of unknown function (DUF6228)